MFVYDFPKIQFGKKDFYVVDVFEYKNTTYLYIYEDVYEEGMDVSNFQGDIEVNFIYKLDNGKFENVMDEKLFNNLLHMASKRLVLNQNPYMKNP